MEVVKSLKTTQLAPKNYSKDCGLPQLNKEENRILSVKYQSKPVFKMNHDELCVNVHKVLLKIHVITGWAIPPNEMMDILIDQTIKKFQESYGNVNMDEIEFAFRNNTTVKDWGKNMNLAMIDEVMIPYLQQRREVSRIEEQQKKELPPPETKPMTDKEFIEMNYNTWKTRPSLGVSTMVYEALDRQGKIKLTKDEKKELYAKTEAMLKGRMTDSNWQEELEKLYKSLNPGHWQERVRNECKRIVVDGYFKTL